MKHISSNNDYLNTKKTQLREFLKKFEGNFDYPDYSSPEYWNNRYLHQKGSSYEWLCEYKEIKPYMIEYLNCNPDSEILMIGCGNSRLSENLYNDGYKNITNIDFSYVVIQEMTEKYKDYEEMDFDAMDIINIDYDDECFDIIIDKGTTDAILCDEVDGYNKIIKILDNIYKILSPNGIYILISSQNPDRIQGLLKQKKFSWKVVVYKIEKKTVPIFEGVEIDQFNFLYLCIKT